MSIFNRSKSTIWDITDVWKTVLKLVYINKYFKKNQISINKTEFTSLTGSMNSSKDKEQHSKCMIIERMCVHFSTENYFETIF